GKLGAAADMPEHDTPAPPVLVPHVERRHAEQSLNEGLCAVNVADVVEADLGAAASCGESKIGQDVAAALPQPPLPGNHVDPTTASKNSPSAPGWPPAALRRTDSP